jgi:dipeptidyl-peptidase-4
MTSSFKYIAAGTIGIASLASASAAPLTVDDYCTPALTSPKGVKEMRPLADGTSYAAVSDDGRRIEVFSYKTGKAISTLFSLDAVKGDLRIDDFDGYALSENEKKILLWNNSEQIYRHSFTAEYYVYDILRSTLKRVSADGPQRNATISHDGRMVAYTRDNNIYISNLDYGTDNAVTTDGKVNSIIYGSPDWAYEEEFGMQNSMCWSTDDSVLAFIRFDESKVPVYTFDRYKSYCEENPLSDIYPDAYSYKYPLAGYPNSTVSVHAYNVDNRTTKKMDLPIGEGYVPMLSFDGEGKNLMAMLLNRDQNRLDLYKVNPGSTVASLVITEMSDAWLSPEAYKMVRYSINSFVIGSERSGWRHLYEYDYSGNLKRAITSGEWNVTAYYGRDARTGTDYIQTTMRGAVNRNVASVDSKGRITVLNDIDGTENAWFSGNFDYYLRKYSNAVTPPVYTICNSRGKSLIDIESNREYAAKYSSVPKMEFTTVPNAEGEAMNACLIKPADFDSSRRYPLMMYQYNGPDSQTVLNEWKMDGVYYIASQGYVVAMVDGRGTGNRSRKWANAVYRNLGHLETADQIAGARNIAKLPYIDAERMACFGWSYGGYMTLMELTAADSPFKAGVSMAPVTDWRLYDSIYTERYMSTPQANPSGYDSASALDRTGNLNARLLIMSGTSDDNVHFYNTLKYTSKLNYEGKIFDMMALAGFEHSLRMCNARSRLYSKIVDFLDSNLK